MELPILNINGGDTGRTANLPDEVFGVEPSDHTIYLDVKQYLANQRQGTHKSKERAEIAGSTRKIKKQKGTGTARAGSIKSPIFRGGGRVFGPRPRNYRFKLNKKVKRLARKSALSYKASESNITVVESFKIETPRTKDFLNILKGISADNSKTLLVLADYDKNILKSSNNLSKARVATVSDLNTYDILNSDKLIIVEDSVEKFSNL